MGCTVVVEIEAGFNFLSECRATSEIRGWLSSTLRKRLLKGLSDLKSHSNGPLSSEFHILRKLSMFFLRLGLVVMLRNSSPVMRMAYS